MPTKNYVMYECRECGCLFIIPKEHIDTSNNYVTCPLHGKHHRVIVVGAHDKLSDCMGARKYKRNAHGALEQN